MTIAADGSGSHDTMFLSVFLFLSGAALAATAYWMVQWLIARYRLNAPDLDDHMDFQAAETLFSSMHKKTRAGAAACLCTATRNYGLLVTGRAAR